MAGYRKLHPLEASLVGCATGDTTPPDLKDGPKGKDGKRPCEIISESCTIPSKSTERAAA